MALSECPECNEPVSTEASACPHCGYKPKSGAKTGCLTLILGGIILISLTSLITNLTSEKQRASNSSTASSTPTQDMELCRAKLKEAQQLDVLADLDWKPPKAPHVVVGPTFFTMPFDAKQGFAQTVNCFLMNGTSNVINFDLLDSMNHRVVGRWEYGRLKMSD